MPSDFPTTGPSLVTSNTDVDLSRQHTLGTVGAGAIELIERVHLTFLQTLQSSLETLLQTQMTIKPGKCTQQTTGAFLASDTVGDVTIALDMETLPCQANMRFPASTLFRVLDILLSAPAGTTTGLRAFMTEIEFHILEEFFNAFAGALTSAWADICPVTFGRSQMPAHKSGSHDGNQGEEAVVVVRGQLWPEEPDMYFDLCLPGFFVRLADLKANQAAAIHESDLPADTTLLDAVAAANVTLDAVLTGSTIRLGDLITMRKGQIVSLGVPPATSFECLANGKSLFAGGMVVTGASQGFCIGHFVGDSGVLDSLYKG